MQQEARNFSLACVAIEVARIGGLSVLALLAACSGGSGPSTIQFRG